MPHVPCLGKAAPTRSACRDQGGSTANPFQLPCCARRLATAPCRAAALLRQCCYHRDATAPLDTSAGTRPRPSSTHRPCELKAPQRPRRRTLYRSQRFFALWYKKRLLWFGHSDGAASRDLALLAACAGCAGRLPRALGGVRGVCGARGPGVCGSGVCVGGCTRQCGVWPCSAVVPACARRARLRGLGAAASARGGWGGGG